MFVSVDLRMCPTLLQHWCAGDTDFVVLYPFWRSVGVFFCFFFVFLLNPTARTSGCGVKRTGSGDESGESSRKGRRNGGGSKRKRSRSRGGRRGRGAGDSDEDWDGSGDEKPPREGRGGGHPGKKAKVALRVSVKITHEEARDCICCLCVRASTRSQRQIFFMRSLLRSTVLFSRMLKFMDGRNYDVEDQRLPVSVCNLCRLRVERELAREDPNFSLFSEFDSVFATLRQSTRVPRHFSCPGAECPLCSLATSVVTLRPKAPSLAHVRVDRPAPADDEKG